MLLAGNDVSGFGETKISWSQNLSRKPVYYVQCLTYEGVTKFHSSVTTEDTPVWCSVIRQLENAASVKG